MSDNPERTRQALDDYFELISSHPECFAERERRPLVTDREQLEQFAQEQGVDLGLLADTPYLQFVMDLVRMRSRNDELIPYLRLLYPRQLAGGVNVVVWGTIENEALGTIGNVVFVEQERHATGQRHLELPRGFGERGLSGEDNARKELKEETGFIANECKLLGASFTDSGISAAEVSFYHAKIIDQTTPTPDRAEMIERCPTLSRDEIQSHIRGGQIRDGFTLQALALSALR